MRNVLIIIDALDIPQVLPLWRAVLGHDTREGGPVDAAIAAGGHVVTDRYAPSWWVLADAEGNEACVATWIGTDGLGYPSGAPPKPTSLPSGSR